VHIFTVGNLQRFVAHLSSSDRRWDSIRRIPYSTPGRWVQALDLSEIMLANPTELLTVDSSFTQLWPLLPFLTSLYLVPDMLLSKRAVTAMACKDGISELRSLKGLKVSAPAGHASALARPLAPSPDAVIELLRNCPLLESLEIACADTISPDLESIIDLDLDPGSLRDEAEAAALPPPLHLPNLESLYLSAIPISQLFIALLRTPLPELRHLAVTPYSGRHTAQLSTLLAAHGRGLTSLRINTPRHLSTSTGDVPLPPVLTSCPELRYLALDQPLPVLLAPPIPTPTPSPAPALDNDDNGESPRSPHPLRVLTVPRPNARFLREVEALLPHLPLLGVVRARAVRWLRAGVSRKALEAGVQGEMHEWRRRFARRGVRLVDSEWRDPE
jgi:hypothetical protein